MFTCCHRSLPVVPSWQPALLNPPPWIRPARVPPPVQSAKAERKAIALDKELARLRQQQVGGRGWVCREGVGWVRGSVLCVRG